MNLGELKQRPIKRLRKSLDSDDILNFQLRGARRNYKNKTVPKGLESLEGFQQLLLKIFPKLQIDERQREKAGRWARIFHLYYRAGFTRKEISEEMNITQATVRMCLYRINKVSKGLETHRLKKRKQ